MPLSAIINEETIIAPNLSKEEWEGLKLRHKKGLSIKMGCCGAPGHLRISKKGTQHFYHAINVECDWEHERIEHLEIKNQIYQTCKSENWEAFTEYPSSDRDWRSDVYATKDGRKIVFEIQISKIPINVLEDRDKKYRNEGIESYWLLNNYLEKSNDFKSGYHEYLYEEEYRIEENVPYIDNSMFDTGSENHVFISKGIRSVGLNIEKQTLYTTNNSDIKIEEWVKQVLTGDYKKYLDKNFTFYHQKRQLKNIAAPLLKQFDEFFSKIICDQTFKNNVDRYYQIFKNDEKLQKMSKLKKKFNLAYFESNRLDKDYRSMVSPHYGLFIWKKNPCDESEEPFFRLESESKINELKECVEELNQCEGFYNTAFNDLEQEIKPHITFNQENMRILMALEKEENVQSDHKLKTKDERHHDPNKGETKISNSKKFDRISNEDKSNIKSDGIHYVIFECALHLETHWLTHSSGMKYQVHPGLPSQIPEDVAREFEQKGYGKIVEQK
jgi:competence CoiA-like predicted nuclease